MFARFAACAMRLIASVSTMRASKRKSAQSAKLS
jgi:hypothetical protein